MDRQDRRVIMKRMVTRIMKDHHLDDDTYYVSDLHDEKIIRHCRRHNISIGWSCTTSKVNGKSHVKFHITIGNAS